MPAKAVVIKTIQKEINYQKSAKIRITNLLITNPRTVKIATNCHPICNSICLVEKHPICNALSSVLSLKSRVSNLMSPVSNLKENPNEPI